MPNLMLEIELDLDLDPEAEARYYHLVSRGVPKSSAALQIAEEILGTLPGVVQSAEARIF